MRELERGRFCLVVAGEEASGRCPSDKTFFGNRRVDGQYKTKLRGRLRRIAQAGFPDNAEAYKCFDGDIHYIKIHGYRAYCMDRQTSQGLQLVVCLVVEKRHSSALADELKSKCRRIFLEHCERFP